jgi:hypothetical protein
LTNSSIFTINLLLLYQVFPIFRLFKKQIKAEKVFNIRINARIAGENNNECHSTARNDGDYGTIWNYISFDSGLVRVDRMWREKEGKGLKELLVVWTRNWFLISSVFVLLFGGIPAVISFPANGSLESAYFMGFLALVGYGIWWVAGALGTIFICATEKIGWKDKCITCITS